MSSKTYFLLQNSIDGRWKVVDQDGWPYADCTTPEDALEHAEDVFGITKVIK